MTRRQFVAMWAVVIAFDLAAFLAILGICLWGVWSPVDWSRSEATLLTRLVDTWALLGLIPGFAMTVAAAAASVGQPSRR